ncbi:hypothetical protein C5167_044755 [Papaver somniferum]|nr:hypothetical protein C5167_044755 [Papaver somniferum]
MEFPRSYIDEKGKLGPSLPVCEVSTKEKLVAEDDEVAVSPPSSATTTKTAPISEQTITELVKPIAHLAVFFVSVLFVSFVFRCQEQFKIKQKKPNIQLSAKLLTGSLEEFATRYLLG